MSSASPRVALPAVILAAALTAIAGLHPAAAAQTRELRVCSDPNNMPFSDGKEEGFENRIMRILADELGADLTYVWWAQRRGFIANALDAGLCDIIPGIAGVDGLLLTYPPYYRSAYSFVTRGGTPLISSFEDPRLKTLRVGVQLVGDDGANTPPAEALSRRDIVDNVRGYSVVGDYRLPNPPSSIIAALVGGEIDVAIAWGPLAGYFAKQNGEGLVVTPVADPFGAAKLPMAFDIAMGLRLDEGILRQEIEGALDRRRGDIDAVLAQYGVPRLDRASPEVTP